MLGRDKVGAEQGTPAANASVAMMSGRLEAGAGEPGRVVHLDLLQGFQLECSENFVNLPLGSQRVLAFLALRTRPQSRSYVASILWMDCNEERAAASLRSALWRINRSGHRLVTANSHVLRLMPDVVVDLWEHARTAHEVLRSEMPSKDSWVEELTVAGDLLPGWYDEWVVIERERFRQLRLHALERLCGQLTAAGRFGQAIETGLAAVSCEPLRESAHRVLIGAYLEEGNRGEAIRQYEACRQILRRELGIEPSPVTQALLPAIKTQQHASR